MKETWVEGNLGSPRRESVQEEEGWQINKETYNALEMSVKLEHPALLASSESFHPNWKVRVDGSERRVERVNFYFKGVFYEEAHFFQRPYH